MSSYTSASSKIKNQSASVSRSMARPAAAAIPSSVVSNNCATTLQKRKPKGKEKRLKRHRGSCPAKIRERITRSVTQRMFLIQKGDVVVEEHVTDYTECPPKSCSFSILGSTGNCYEVQIQRLPSCTCPDHAKGNLCKHVLFVSLKVMEIDPFSPLIYQSAWLSTELEEMFATMEQRFARVRDNTHVMANEKVQAAFTKMQDGQDVEEITSKAKQRQVGSDDDCPICFDALQEPKTANWKSSIVYCRMECGANFHKQCIDAWMRQSQNKSSPTCPCCRQTWDDGTNRNTEGYSNFGQLQGQSPERDTSSYRPIYSPSFYGKRRRYY